MRSSFAGLLPKWDLQRGWQVPERLDHFLLLSQARIRRELDQKQSSPPNGLPGSRGAAVSAALQCQPLSLLSLACIELPRALLTGSAELGCGEKLWPVLPHCPPALDARGSQAGPWVP